MADVLRVPKVLGVVSTFPALRSYVDRVCARPAFKKAYDGQMAHFAAGDK
jgi:glutathione S-transferase